MAQDEFRYTGRDLEIRLGGVIVSNDYTSFSVKITRSTKEKTAGNERWQSYNDTTKKIEWDLERFDTAEAGDDVRTVLYADGRQLLSGFPKGNVSGKPVFSFYAIIESVDNPFKNDDNVTIKVSGIGSGEPVVPFTAYGSGT